ncbi:class I SAM-dependent methyltransferase [Agromyces protaetiae]|uniref:Class I SAM-dependent methyltransferase n=1 Tax=Agromyces protaetiae TaxID=2509455 RepID=A0A4P6FBL2_9MICO|nr:class I SAM-dependent methyltransferase [Agromyces protaetiae]QAY72313.1 class I SAM-dependent methyltransferase [Agromyces protaetiae]
MSLTIDPRPTARAAGPTADEFAERALGALAGWAESMAMHLGVRLGWYAELAAHGPSTADELANRTHTSARYAREWLEQQAVTGVLSVAEPAEGAGTRDVGAAGRRFAIAPGVAEALTDERSLAYIGPLPRMLAAVGVQMPALVEAYRTGGGVSWDELGDDARHAQADANRPWYDRLPEVFAGVERLDRVLSRPSSRVADVGMGAGWSSIALASAYPDLRVDGFDVDAPSVGLARANAEAAGVSDRVRFHLAGGDSIERLGPFDAAFAFECLHDMPRPVEVLRAMRGAVRDDGPVVVMDEAVGDGFAVPGADLDALMYAFSLFVCLPDSMSHPGSVATGTVMRPDTLREYAREAGFDGLDVLPIEGFGFWRFYELTRAA